MNGFAKLGSSVVYDMQFPTLGLSKWSAKCCKKTHFERWLNCYVAIPLVHIAHKQISLELFGIPKKSSDKVISSEVDFLLFRVWSTPMRSIGQCSNL
jgi:hypothetical protein